LSIRKFKIKGVISTNFTQGLFWLPFRELGQMRLAMGDDFSNLTGSGNFQLKSRRSIVKGGGFYSGTYCVFIKIIFSKMDE